MSENMANMWRIFAIYLDEYRNETDSFIYTWTWNAKLSNGHLILGKYCLVYTLSKRIRHVLKEYVKHYCKFERVWNRIFDKNQIFVLYRAQILQENN